MSSLTRYSDQPARRLTTQSARAAARSRRADEGTVTEMARLLLRDARAAHPDEARPRQGDAGTADRTVRAGRVAGADRAVRVDRAVRRELVGGRLSSRPLAAPRA